MIKIKRMYLPQCTLGVLTVGDFRCFTLELPTLDNAPDISCIYAAGGFRGYKHFSPHNGDVIAIDNVMDRTHIQIHSGNFTRDILGCILVGDSIKFLDGDNIPDVTNSRNTLKKLLAELPDTFNIEIS